MGRMLWPMSTHFLSAVAPVSLPIHSHNVGSLPDESNTPERSAVGRAILLGSDFLLVAVSAPEKIDLTEFADGDQLLFRMADDRHPRCQPGKDARLPELPRVPLDHVRMRHLLFGHLIKR